jgi:hypothetical protein
VLHTDGDMLFGGGSQTWLDEAVTLLQERPDLLVAGPLPGPPTADGRLPEGVAARHGGTWAEWEVGTGTEDDGMWPERVLGGPALRFRHMSSRVFLIDRARLLSRVAPFPLAKLTPRLALVALWNRNPRYGPFEVALSKAMARRGLFRLDFLGTAGGMWSLHPVRRTEAFYRSLPDLIRRVEEGDIPAGQRGDYNINESLLPA